MIETVVDVCMPGLPDKFTYLDCLPFDTGENTMDFVGPEEFLRIQFVSEQGRQYAQEQALVRLSPPSRFLGRTFSKEQRRSVVMEGQDKDCKVEYVTMHLKKEKLVFQNHDVPLCIWLPPVPEVAELAVGMESDGEENLGEFGLGYLLSAFKDYLTKAGWVDEETLSIMKRKEDARGRFLNKYQWFEHCSIPSHLFAVRGVAEFESGIVAGVSCVKLQTNLLSHRRLVKQLENTANQKEKWEGAADAVSKVISKGLESQGVKLDQLQKALVKQLENTASQKEKWEGATDAVSKVISKGLESQGVKLDQTQKEVEQSASTIKKIGDGYSVFLEWRKKQIQRNAASAGGQANGRKVMIENAAKALVLQIPDDLSVETKPPYGRRKMTDIPDGIFCHKLLEYMCGVDTGMEFFEKEITNKRISRKMFSNWQKKVISLPPVVRLLERIEGQGDDGVSDESEPGSSSQ